MPGRFVPAFRNIPIKRKLVIIFAVFFIIPFLVSSLAFSIASRRDITRREYDRSLETLKLFQNSVEARLRESAEGSVEIYNDYRIFAPLERKVPARFDEFQLFQLQQALQSFRAGHEYLESVYLFFPNGQYVFADTSGGGRFASLYMAHPQWEKDIDQADGRAYWIASIVIPSLHDPLQPIYGVSFGRVIRNIYSSTFFKAGILAVNLKSQLFDDIGKSNELSGNGLYIVTDRDDNLVWSADRAWFEKEVVKGGLLGRLRSRGNDTLRRESIGGKSYFAAYRLSAYNGWHYVALIPEADILRQSSVLLNFSAAIALLCLLLSVFGAAAINRYVTDPIERLIVSMNRMGRDPVPALRQPESTDEIGFLHKSYNAMSERIQNLISEAETAHRSEKEHEIQALQAQINPHFLSNTLDAINWIARERNEPKISRLLTALSRILQYSIGNGHAVSWREEIQWLKNYVYLQRTRSGDKLEVLYDIDESIYDLTTFHLLLQPFVENAIQHGFRDRAEGGVITIRGRLQDGRVTMEIADNGCGMNEAKIDQIFSGASDGIGIFNVHERIRLTYGPPYGVSIESNPPQGTLVTIAFPALKAVQ